MASYLVTGVAGFIASQVTQQLVGDGHQVVGIDNLNDAYDVRLKHWRLERIRDQAGLVFHQVDVTDRASLERLFQIGREGGQPPFDGVINLAARAGVRQSVENPWIYIDSADVLDTWADISKAERLLDWKPQHTFHDGVERLVRWSNDNRDWAKEITTSS